MADKIAFMFGMIFVAGLVVAGFGAIFAKQFFVLFLLTLMPSLIFGIFTLLFASKTNAWAELKSSMRGTPMLMIYRRDRTIERTTCKMSAGMADTKNDGTFMITPDSVYRDKKTGIPALSAFSDYGVTVNPKFAMVATKLKKEKIENISEAEKVNQELAEEGKQISIPVPLLETVKFDDIIGFFKYHVSPHYIASAVERRTVLGLRGVRQIPIAWISVMAILFVAAALAYVMVVSVGNSPPNIGNAIPSVVPNIIS